MASRSRHHSRPQRDSDSLEALKPLVVLVLFGTILYGAYSVVQKGPAPADTATASTSEAPVFSPPTVDVASQSLPAVGPAATAVATAPNPSAAAAVPPGPAAIPTPMPPPVSAPATPIPANEPAAAASMPLTTMPEGISAAPPAMPQTPPPAAVVAESAMVGAAAAAATVAAMNSHPSPTASVSAAAPTYLTAESAPPPAADSVATTGPLSPGGQPAAADRPDRYATLGAMPPGVMTSRGADAPETIPPTSSIATGSSNAFATAWADAHEKLGAGRYAEALAALSIWYDDPSLGLEESQRLEDLLGQLAGTVIYSQQDLLLPPHVVANGETLPAIAAQLGVSWQLLAKINGVDHPMQLLPGEHLKLVQGPFDAVVSVSRRRLSLQIGGNYAGSFPVVVGRQLLSRVGTAIPVAEVRRLEPSSVVTAAPQRTAIVMADGLLIEASEDPGMATDTASPTSLVVSVRDLDELVDILGPGSTVLVRQ